MNQHGQREMAGRNIGSTIWQHIGAPLPQQRSCYISQAAVQSDLGGHSDELFQLELPTLAQPSR